MDLDAETLLAEEAAAKEHEKLLVIPEKASSFRYHPEKLCEDQCFYCGGKFGLFDTPCHIAQIKSAERQKKILDCTFPLIMISIYFFFMRYIND